MYITCIICVYLHEYVHVYEKVVPVVRSRGRPIGLHANNVRSHAVVSHFCEYLFWNMYLCILDNVPEFKISL